jgi:hypothetical protein
MISLIRRVWDEDNNGVYITDDQQFQLLIDGKKGLEPIGFPHEDVFKYDPELASSMDQLSKEDKWDWNKLVSF